MTGPTETGPAATLAALAARAERHATPCGDGEMVWRVWGAHADKQPLILLHGGSGSWNHWVKQIPVFADRYEVWVPDLPGLGDSDMPHEPLTPETCGSVVAQGVFALFPERRRPHLAAFSFGAHIGTFAAVMLGERLKSFTLSGAAALGLPHFRAEFAKEHVRMSDEERAAVHRTNLGILMIADPACIDDLAVYCQAENIRRARFRSRAFATTDQIARKLPEVAAPVAAVWGAKDQICLPDVESRRRVLLEVKPNLLWRSISDAGHWAMYERADAYNAALADVLIGLGA